MSIVYRDAVLEPGKIELVTEWIQRQRWYAGKGHSPTLHRVGGYRFDDPDGEVGMEVLLLADTAVSPPVVYQVPLSYRSAALDGAEEALVGTMEHGVLGTRWVYDAPHDPLFPTALVGAILTSGASQDAQVDHGSNALAVGTSTGVQTGSVSSSSVLSGEQSNTSTICRMLDEHGHPAPPVIVKVFRTLQHGDNPDVVLQSALTAAGCDHVPLSLGHLAGSWDAPEGSGSHYGHLAFAQEFIPGVEDAWRVALVACASNADFTDRARELGSVTAQIHAALAQTLGREEATPAARAALLASMRSRFEAAVAVAPQLATRETGVNRLADAVREVALPVLQRIHGDYHLGQVIDVPERGWVALDFEGEPLRPLAERALPDLTQRDLAGMLRSFDYVAGSVARGGPSADVDAAVDGDWARAARAAFLDGYAAVAGPPDADAVTLTKALEVDKALYEVVYEAQNRPTWIPIPLEAIDRLLDQEGAP